MEKSDGISEIISWIEHLNKTVFVDIRKIPLEKQLFWYYDDVEGAIVNKNRSFFSITGIRREWEGKVAEQPIIIQNEIGYLGILCQKIGRTMHYLMQAKIEPGNLNHIQISPTIQATKSNFMRSHGGCKPFYLDMFVNANPENIIVDQIQSEQASRFLKKRNRNIVLQIPEGIDISVSPMHRWMTLEQIKELMKVNNLVNMDARTVISCIPRYKTHDDSEIAVIYHFINNYKMFRAINSRLVPLYSLENWCMENGQFSCLSPYPFKLIFADITIEGREVSHWTQPLFEAIGKATFGLFSSVVKGTRKYLVCARPEIGSFDHIELGPTVQLESTESPSDAVEELFLEQYSRKKGVMYDVVLSEEGGRFYREQNRNIILDIDQSEVPAIEGYFWLTFDTLNRLTQINNILNIQIRNLLSILEDKWID